MFLLTMRTSSSACKVARASDGIAERSSRATKTDRTTQRFTKGLTRAGPLSSGTGGEGGAGHIAARYLRRPAALRRVLLLGLFDHADQGLDLADGFRAAPHEHPVDVPVAALETAAFQVVNSLAQDEGAGGEGAADKRLPADVDRLVPERFAFVLGQEHAWSLRCVWCLPGGSLARRKGTHWQTRMSNQRAHVPCGRDPLCCIGADATI